MGTLLRCALDALLRPVSARWHHVAVQCVWSVGQWDVLLAAVHRSLVAVHTAWAATDLYPPSCPGPRFEARALPVLDAVAALQRGGDARAAAVAPAMLSLPDALFAASCVVHGWWMPDSCAAPTRAPSHVPPPSPTVTAPWVPLLSSEGTALVTLASGTATHTPTAPQSSTGDTSMQAAAAVGSDGSDRCIGDSEASVPLSHSGVWTAQQHFYASEGQRAWSSGVVSLRAPSCHVVCAAVTVVPLAVLQVPFEITNSRHIASAYAHVAAQFMASCAAVGVSECVVVELGSGTCRFGFFFTTAVLALARDIPCRVRVVLTDISESVLRPAMDSPCFR